MKPAYFYGINGALLLIITAVSPLFAEDREMGKRIYYKTCVVCHGQEGKGSVPGAPDFTAAGSPLKVKERKVLLRHIIEGYHSESSPMAMPARGGNPELTDADIGQVLDFMIKAFAPKGVGVRAKD